MVNDDLYINTNVFAYTSACIYIKGVPIKCPVCKLINDKDSFQYKASQIYCLFFFLGGGCNWSMKKSSVSCSKNYQIEDDFECIYNLALEILYLLS